MPLPVLAGMRLDLWQTLLRKRSFESLDQRVAENIQDGGQNLGLRIVKAAVEWYPGPETIGRMSRLKSGPSAARTDAPSSPIVRMIAKPGAFRISPPGVIAGKPSARIHRDQPDVIEVNSARLRRVYLILAAGVAVGRPAGDPENPRNYGCGRISGQCGRTTP